MVWQCLLHKSETNFFISLIVSSNLIGFDDSPLSLLKFLKPALFVFPLIRRRGFRLSDPIGWREIHGAHAR